MVEGVCWPGQETQETRVQPLDWEDPLGKEMAAHSSILAWKIPWTEEPGGLESTGSQRVRHDCSTSHHSVRYGLCVHTCLHAVLVILTFTLFFRKLLNSEGFRNVDL